MLCENDEREPIFLAMGIIAVKMRRMTVRQWIFLWMKIWDDIYHHVDDIKNFAVIYLKHAVLLDTRHVVHLLFEFKENRLFDSQEVLLIRNVVECWARDGGTSLFPQCVSV